MSYETDCMIALKNALRDTEGLKIALKEFNKIVEENNMKIINE